jgi:hypothetical protein
LYAVLLVAYVSVLFYLAKKATLPDSAAAIVPPTGGLNRSGALHA